MSNNTLSKETQIRLLNFFNERIEPVEMAKTLRQVNFTLALGIMSEHEELQNEITKLRDSFYWLNELAETLNPYLDLEWDFKKKPRFKKSRFFFAINY
jgi:hypothetical protein